MRSWPIHWGENKTNDSLKKNENNECKGPISLLQTQLLFSETCITQGKPKKTENQLDHNGK